MTGLQRVAAALSPAGSPELPVVICYEGIFVRDHWAQLTDLPWWYQFAPDLERQLQWRTAVAAALPLDWIHLPAVPPRAVRERQVLEVSAAGVWRLDQASGAREELLEPQVSGWSPTGEVASVHPAQPASNTAEVDALTPLPEPVDPAAYRAAGRADLAAALRAAIPDRYAIRHVNSPLWECYSLWGFEDLMMLLITDPELIHHACERFTQRALATVAEAAALGAQGVWIEEALTDLLGAPSYEQLCLPYLQRVVQAIRGAGMQSIHYYCGSPAGKWDLLLASGADALALEEGKKGFEIEIAEVVRQVAGRAAVFGNLDAIHVLQDGGELSLARAIAAQQAAASQTNGRFVLSVGSPVTPGTSVERVRRYYELGRLP